MKTLLATWQEPGRVAIEAGWKKVAEGGSVLDGLEAGLAAAEADTDLIMIGRGSLPNSAGELELDASIMRGSDFLAGAVCSVKGIFPTISLARKVMEDTPHIMLAGDQAVRYALSEGFRVEQTLTPNVLQMWEEWRVNPERIRTYQHVASDTVTMLGVDSGRTFAASSTSGLPFKQPGRVGDSPIFGAGIYADDEVGAAGATGNGEELWKAVASMRALEHMRAGMSPTEACEAVIQHMFRRQPKVFELPCVVFVISPNGEYGAACSLGEFELWVCRDGEFRCEVYGPSSPK